MQLLLHEAGDVPTETVVRIIPEADITVPWGFLRNSDEL